MILDFVTQQQQDAAHILIGIWDGKIRGETEIYLTFPHCTRLTEKKFLCKLSIENCYLLCYFYMFAWYFQIHCICFLFKVISPIFCPNYVYNSFILTAWQLPPPPCTPMHILFECSASRPIYATVQSSYCI